MDQPPIKPTEAELEVLQVLWQLGSATVRDVHEALSRTKDSVYTTTLKIMQKMHEKGLVERDEHNRTHVYRATVPEEEMQQQLLHKFIDATFRGSAMKLVMQALGNQAATPDELEKVQQLLEQLRRSRK
ncbi:MAG: BlaI/MecI/CopY family transcriptional regulator [Cytophagales bacterium]|nr:BlaI/MecI/CopY family transcriptional regulator [Cytophagales bacterium]